MSENGLAAEVVRQLRAAAASGALPETLYQALVVGERGASVGGDMTGVMVTGDGNVVHYYEAATAPDETALLQAAVADYERPLSVSAADSPYQGLQPYRLQDADRFFGRAQAAADVVTHLQRKRVVWLHGRSGTGKSSLLQAGVRPLLQPQALVVGVRLLDESPAMALKKELLRGRWSPTLQLAAAPLLSFLTSLQATVAGRPLILFFDQFEAFFLRRSAAEQATFARDLPACVADETLHVRFVFALRSDFFGETGAVREMLPAESWVEYRLRSLTLAEATAAIEQPLLQRGILFADGVAAQLVADLADDEIGLPQLQLVCQQLYQGLDVGETVVTMAHYRRLAGTKGVLVGYLQRVLADEQAILAEERAAARYLLTTLVDSEGRRTYRTAATWYGDSRWQMWSLAWHAQRLQLTMGATEAGWQQVRDLVVAQLVREIPLAAGIEAATLAAYAVAEAVAITNKGFVEQVLGRLLAARLLRETATEDGALAYELVHDCLTEEIGGWLDEAERAARPVRELLGQAEVNLRRHRLWLKEDALAVVEAQLANPRLVLVEKEWRLVLLSAAALGGGRAWLARVGDRGVAWLRAAYGDEGLPLAVRTGAAATLGAMGDGVALAELQAGVVGGERPFVALLAHYLQQTETMPTLPWRVRRAVAWPLARLQVAAGKAEIMQMARRAMQLALLAVLVTMVVYVLRPFISDAPSGNWVGNLLVVVIFGILGVATAFGFAVGLTSLDMISKRWSRWRRLVGLIVLGGVPGFFLFLFMTLEPWTGLGGAVIGFVLGVWPQHKVSKAATWLLGVVGLGVAAAVWLLTATPAAAERWVDAVAACVAGAYVVGYLWFAVGRNGR